MKTWTVLACILLIQGCGSDDDDSSPSNTTTQTVATADLFPEFTARCEGSGSSVAKARLRVGDATSENFYDLQTGESLGVTFDKQSETLKPSEAHTYALTVPYDANVTFGFGLIRATEEESAPLSLAVLPRPFTLAVGSTSVARSAPVDITWQLAGANEETVTVFYNLTGDCIAPLSGQTTDTGKLTIAGGQLTQAGSGGSCTVRVTLEHVITGTLHHHFTKGLIEARQVRTAEFTSTP